MATTFKFGNGNWAVKEDYALAYNDENGNFKPLPFDFTRASTASRVNKDGLLETMDRGMPRIDFLNNTSGHLLLEPSRSNKITRSIPDSNWNIENGASITEDYAISPDGTQNASRVQIPTGSLARIYRSFTVDSNEDSVSFYIKSNTGSNFNVAFYLRDSGFGTVRYQDTSLEVTTEWQRVKIENQDLSAASVQVMVLFYNTAGSGDTWDFSLWGVQAEGGSYATSYIPTSGSSVTRLADDVDTDYGSKNTLSDEVSVYFNLLPQVEAANNANKCLSFSFNSSNRNNSYAVLRCGSTTWSTRIQGTTGNNFDNLGVDKTEEIKAVMVLTQSGYSLYANGSTAVASGSYGGTAPTINSVAFVEILNDTDDRGVYKIKELKVYNTALTEAEAQALTS